MQFKGIGDLAGALDAEVVPTMEALERCAEDGTLMTFLEVNRDLLKQERAITMNAKLVTLFDHLVGAVKCAAGEPINVARFFETDGVDLYSKVGDLGMYGLFQQVERGVWVLTDFGRSFYENPTVTVPRTIWVRNCEVVREHPERINYMVALNAATK